MPLKDILDVTPTRRASARRLAEALRGKRRVAVTTHINADGDAAGSVAALALLLPQLGIEEVVVVNPTPWPALFAFLLTSEINDQTHRGPAALKGIDALISLDVSDMKRIGHLADTARALRIPKLVVDHHVPTDEPAGDIVLVDSEACATGELLYDLAIELGLTITEDVAVALYTAILTDTGGFRFSNTSPRAHAIAAVLLGKGVDPEEIYRRIYASVSIGRLMLLREALNSLGVDGIHGLAWISVSADALERFSVSSEDLDGIVDHPRSIAGTRMALFFRELSHGKVKVSFRSAGDVDVNRFARQFGGGGHAKASGALIPGSLDAVRNQVVEAARSYVGHLTPAATDETVPA